MRRVGTFLLALLAMMAFLRGAYADLIDLDLLEANNRAEFVLIKDGQYFSSQSIGNPAYAHIYLDENNWAAKIAVSGAINYVQSDGISVGEAFYYRNSVSSPQAQLTSSYLGINSLWNLCLLGDEGATGTGEVKVQQYILGPTGYETMILWDPQTATGEGQYGLPQTDDGILWAWGQGVHNVTPDYIALEYNKNYSFWVGAESGDGDKLIRFSATNPVPEPSTMILFGAGLIGLINFGRMKRR